MKKTRVNTKNSIEKTKKEKFGTTHYEMKSRLGLPIDAKYVDVLISKLREWLTMEEEPLRISQFCRFMGIPRTTFYRLCQDYPHLNTEYEEAKLIFADRMLMGAVYIKKGMREQACLRYIHVYDPEFLDADNKVESMKLGMKKEADIEIAKIKSDLNKVEEAKSVRVFLEHFSSKDNNENL